MDKIDLSKERADLYKPSAKAPVLVDVPEWQYIMIDGRGDPNTSKEYQDAIAALYSISYILKFMVKKGPTAVDYRVMPLEGLWWAKDMAEFTAGSKDNWFWTMMIRQPEFITAAMYKEALAKAKEKAKAETGVLKQLSALYFAQLTEGKCATIMHIGPFSAEGPTIAGLHKFIRDQGMKPAGKHHEIYLSDIRKADPAKWKTVLRQPVGK